MGEQVLDGDFMALGGIIGEVFGDLIVNGQLAFLL